MSALKELHDRIANRIVDMQEEADAIEHQIGLLEAKLNLKLVALDELRALLPQDDEATEQDEGNAVAPEPAGAKRNGKQPGRKKGVSKYPPLIREVLLKGPKTFTEIMEALGADGSCIRKPMNECGWFEKTDPGNRLSPWQLTEVGRNAS